MPATYPVTVKNRLALWLADGGSIRSWCREHRVSLKTACTWCKAEAFERRVEAHRRRAADRALGEMAREMTRAVAEIDRLVEHGRDDAVKLAAARALLDMFLDGRGQAELKAEVRRLIRSAAP